MHGTVSLKFAVECNLSINFRTYVNVKNFLCFDVKNAPLKFV